MSFTLHLCILPLHIRDIRKVRKDSTSTLSLVIHRVRLKKKPAKKYISIQGGGETQETIIFLSASTAATT
jgi:hypothetical protein